MHRLVHGLPACIALLLLGGVLRADGTEPLFPSIDLSGPSAPHAYSEPAADTDGSHESLFSMNLMVGTQTGVRAQGAVVRRNEWEFVGEGYFGILLTGLGFASGGGLGGRAIWRCSSADGKDSLLIGPGMDLMYQTELFGRKCAFLAPSVDVSWLHGVGDRSGWEIGLNLGVGVGVAGERFSNQSAVGVPTPLISVFTGFRY